MGKWLESKRKEQPDRLAFCTLQPNAFHIYTQPADGFHRSAAFAANEKNLRIKKPKGELSDKARKRIENAIQWLLFKSDPKPIYNREHDKVYFFRLNFITLTLPALQQHTDKEIISVCLNNFLNVLRANGLADYLWRAEPQPSTDNIHFHLTTNKFFHWREVRKWWNQSLNLLGYVDRFHAKWHHRNPPSTEIRKVKHIRKLAGYLSKYMAKEKAFAPAGELRRINGKLVEVLYTSKMYRDEKSNQKVGQVVGTVLYSDKDGNPKKLRRVDARLWSCSQSISKCKPFRVDMTCIQWDAIREMTFHPKFRKCPGDYVDSYYGPVIEVSKLISPGLYEDLKLHSRGGKIEVGYSDNKILQYLS